MIEIIPLNLKDIFDKEYVNGLQLIEDSNNNCYITSIDLISKLLAVDLPIKNERLAITNILSFLNYFDSISNSENIATIPVGVLIKYFTTIEYKKYLAILKELHILSDIVYKDENNQPMYKYKVGEASKRYRAFDAYVKSDLCLVVIDSTKPLKIDIEEGLVPDKFRKTIETLEINYKNAISDEITNFQAKNMSIDVLRKRIARLLTLRVRRFIKSGVKVDRIYHSFSNLSKISRRHTLVNFNNIDIVNCQPLLLCAYLTKNGYQIDQKYKNDCEAGLIYENFVGDLPREEVKVELYKSIYFKFNTKNKYNQLFKEVYPITWESLLKLSKEEKSMACILQNFEASLFNQIEPKKSSKYYTLFDAIYYDNIADSAAISNIIYKFFSDLDIKVTITLNDIKVSK